MLPTKTDSNFLLSPESDTSDLDTFLVSKDDPKLDRPSTPPYITSPDQHDTPFSPITPGTRAYMLRLFSSPFTAGSQDVFPAAEAASALPRAFKGDSTSSTVSSLTKNLGVAAGLSQSPVSLNTGLPSSAELSRNLSGACLLLGQASMRDFPKISSIPCDTGPRIAAPDDTAVSPLSSRDLCSRDFLGFLDAVGAENTLCADEPLVSSTGSLSRALSCEFAAGHSDSVSNKNKRKANSAENAEQSGSKSKRTSRSGREIKSKYSMK